MKSVMIYRDEKAEVHAGDTVRYIRYNWGTVPGEKAGRFYRKTGTITEIRPPHALGIHFPHYQKGTNIIAVDSETRLVSCPHQKEAAS